jgi:hypothetical protein
VKQLSKRVVRAKQVKRPRFLIFVLYLDHASASNAACPVLKRTLPPQDVTDYTAVK